MKEKKFKKFKVNKTPIEDKSTVSDKATKQGNKFADFDVEELFKYDFKEDERVDYILRANEHIEVYRDLVETDALEVIDTTNYYYKLMKKVTHFMLSKEDFQKIIELRCKELDARVRNSMSLPLILGKFATGGNFAVMGVYKGYVDISVNDFSFSLYSIEENKEEGTLILRYESGSLVELNEELKYDAFFSVAVFEEYFVRLIAEVFTERMKNMK